MWKIYYRESKSKRTYYPHLFFYLSMCILGMQRVADCIFLDKQKIKINNKYIELEMCCLKKAKMLSDIT